ncbi:glycosyltransferase family 2 protein [Opacimonas viscosa]|uniref:Glycosyltransferase family 2 protein n=1 Tax=Opacimonas viscosa TaxID=2961944 RepID=A0AA41X2E8_9ALTE|nr:glycosyltransferase family 2 protein [Opacimonas viscosa]MCP3429121.1 glycosyltransferase family 2 protein [Opacimonas viscosa]
MTVNQKISIVTVVYNAFEEFEALLKSLDCMNLQSETFELIVVYNGNFDEFHNIKNILGFYSVIYKLYHVKNYGFAHGCNYGVERAKYEIIWLLNSDCRISIDTFNNMLKMFIQFPNDILGSKIVYPNGSVQCIGGGKLNFFVGFQKQSKVMADLDYICGASLMISKSNYIKLGMIDESFFLYWEETDFCYRAKRLGLKLRVNENAIVYHEVGASTDIKSLFTEYYSTRNAIAFFKRHGSKSYFYPIVLINMVVKILNRVIRMQFKRIPILLYALWDGVKGNMGITKRNLNES